MKTVFTHTTTDGSEMTVEAELTQTGRRYTISLDRPGIAAVSHTLDEVDFDAMIAACRTFPGTD